MKRYLLAPLMVLICTTSIMAQNVNPATLPADCFLFTSFRGNGDGLHLAWSSDGMNWSALQNDRNFLPPTLSREKLMRDPCLVQGPDGMFHLVWTTGWNQKTIGYSNSKDLITWTEQKEIPVMMHEETARNSWAPELFWDETKQHWLIYWATTIPGRFEAGATTGDSNYNHRIYSTTTRDFVTFTPTKLFFDPGFNVIDSTIIKVGDKYHMILKDETRTPARKYLQVATASSLDGPWTVTPTFTPPGVWVEGPSMSKVGDWYYCYYDMYRDGKYGLMRTKDFVTWENLTDKLKFAGGRGNVRHGTAIKVSPQVLANLLNHTPPASQPGR